MVFYASELRRRDASKSFANIAPLDNNRIETHLKNILRYAPQSNVYAMKITSATNRPCQFSNNLCPKVY